jgi:hypothetical protein
MTKPDRLDAKLAFHDIPIGADLGSVDYEITDSLARRHLQSTHQTEYPTEGDLSFAPASILASDGIRLAETRYDISESVHAGQRLEVLDLPIVGSTVTVSGRLTDKFERKGRQYVVMETDSRDDRGRLLARGRMVGVARYRPEASP